MIPSVDQCLTLMDQYRMLDNIRAHSLMVGRVAGLLGSSLVRAGVNLSLDLLLAGALLHDIAKTQSLGRDELRHDVLGGEICRAHGFPELAEIVAEHVILRDGSSAHGCSEKEIVYYADKRVLHDRVVGLDAREAYILDRYGRDDRWIQERIRENFVQARLLEARIFAYLDYPPDAVAWRVKEASEFNGVPEVDHD